MEACPSKIFQIIQTMHNTIINRLTDNRNLIEKSLSAYYPESNESYSMLIDSQRYSLLGGGKRIRGSLVIEFCKLFGGDIESALPYACAIEMIHCSSLIHDDLPCMDNDDYRRGKLSNHKVFTEGMALLSGDAMMAKAFEIVATNHHLSASTNMIAVTILSRSTGTDGMLGGQAIDLVAANKKLDLEVIYKLHALKTGKLISASAKLGCLAAGIEESDERMTASVRYAENVGLAFQIIDDILDYEEGKRELNSFLSHISVEEAKELALNLTNEAIDIIRPYDNGVLEGLATYLTSREN